MAAKPLKSKSPMRKRGTHFSERRDQIQVDVVRKMLANEWVTGLSDLELAKKYRLHEDTARRIAADASRHIRLAYSDKEDMRVRVLSLLDLGARKSLEAEQHQYDQQTHRFKSVKKPDLRALRDFAQLQAEVHGLVRSAKAEPSVIDATGTAVGVDLGELNNLLGGIGYQAVPKPLPPSNAIEHEQSSTASAEPTARKPNE